MIRPRRSVLYVPGINARAMEKAAGLPADAIIFDLEDSVTPDAKAEARTRIAHALATHDYGARELVLRINGADTDHAAADYALAGTLAIHGVLLPKVEQASMVAAAACQTTHPIWCMIETPLGVLNAPAIAAQDRVAGFVVGTNDLAKDLRVRQTPDRAALVPSLALILLAARAHGIVAIDGVHGDLDDLDGFEAACRQGAMLGFDGKSLVHPSTIAAANCLFGPDAADVAEARAIVAAWDAQAGVARIGSQMIEQLHVDDAKRLIAMAEAIEEQAAAPPQPASVTP